MSEQINKLLNGGRMALGLASLVAPDQAFRGTGLDSRGNPQMPFMTRMFGVRDLVLGAGALTASGGERTRWLQACVAADAADAVAALLGHRGGYMSTQAAVMMGGVAAAATVAGIVALLDQ